MLPICLGEATKVCGRLLDSGARRYRVHRRSSARAPHRATAKAEVDRARRRAAARRPRRRRRAAGFLGAAEPGPAHVLGAEARRQAALRAGARGQSGRARAARTIEIFASLRVRLEPATSSSSTSIARRAPISAPWPRTLRDGSAPAATSRGLRRADVEPFGDADVHAGAADRRGSRPSGPRCCCRRSGVAGPAAVTWTRPPSGSAAWAGSRH